MSIRPVSFGIQLKYKKNYEVRKKDGTPVSKEYADKIVKRNMMLTNMVAMPIGFSAIASAIWHKKGDFKAIAATALILSGTIGLVTHWNYKMHYLNDKEFNPQPFYKWGGFKVVEKDK